MAATSKDSRHRQQRGHDHLLEGGLRDDVHARPVLGQVRALENARMSLELASHLGDDTARRPADSIHAEG